jgi:hypothetical protein
VDPVSLIRKQYKGAHDLLEVTINGVTPDQAQWTPPGTANPLGSTYVHIVTGEDAVFNMMIRRATPLFGGDFADKLGVSEPPPAPGHSWAEWARAVRVELPVLRDYARAVYASTDDYLSSLTAEDLDTPIDMSAFGMGQQPLYFLVAGVMLQHVNNHLGEIACLKGVQGAQGYPF